MGFIMAERDEELYSFIRNIIITVVILLICSTLFVIAMINKNSLGQSNIEKIVKKKETVLILFRGNDCKNCKKIEKELKDNNLYYIVWNVDSDRYIKTNLGLLDLNRNDIVLPTVAYIHKGKVYSTLVDIKKIDDLVTYLEYNKLTN